MTVSSCISCVVNEWTLLIAIAVFFLYKWGTSTFSYFDERGVPFIKPVAIIGNGFSTLSGREHAVEFILRMYKTFKDKRIYGIFDMRDPVIIVRDPELVKQITVKDFEHFVDHRVLMDETTEPLFAKSVVSLTGQKWRNMRATLSPMFTGSKMREMFELLIACAERTSSFLIQSAKDTNSSVIDMKDLSTRFTNDVIASCAFGLEVDSLKDKENEFFLMGKTVSNFGALALIKFVIISIMPKVSKFLKLRLFPKKLADRFSEIVLDTIEHREKNNIIRRDVIQLLIEARAGSLSHNESSDDSHNDGFATAQESSIHMSLDSKQFVLENEDLVAQCLIFFFAGFETSSVLMCYCVQELIQNPDVQQKLLLEVTDVKEKLNGKPMTYEVLQKMKYLDMVISETLRKWPVAFVIDRICTKPLDIDNHGKTYHFEVGDKVMINVIGIQSDPDYYPDPSKFNPERFSDENKRNIKPFTYLPFGTGPRNCIGSRFALMESKVFIYYLLANFSLDASNKTQIPITTKDLKPFTLHPKKGFWCQLKLRN